MKNNYCHRVTTELHLIIIIIIIIIVLFTGIILEYFANVPNTSKHALWENTESLTFDAGGVI